MTERNDAVKTVAFAVVAAASRGATFTSPRNVDTAEDNDATALFFPDLKLESIKGLEITDYDPKTAKTDMFRIEYKKGGWVLPLKEDYPADAKDALAKATSWLTSATRDVNLTSDKNQYAELGVLNPTDEKGTTGVGILFRALDENKNVLAELIVGKEVEGKTGWRYVREPKSDVVYRANVGEFSVSTRFRDWIEKDLLELSDSVRTLSAASERDREKYKKNIGLVQWTDYKVNPRQLPAQVLEKKTESLAFTGGTEWAPQAALQGLPPNLETNADKVRDLTDALKNMQIVDVFSKPPGLGPDLKMVMKSGRITEEDDAKLKDLAGRGFYATEDRDVVPTSGELKVETKEGIVYRIRFGLRVRMSEEGKIIGGQKDDEAAAPTNAKNEKADAKITDPAKKPEDDKAKDENRFVLIAVSFDESKFPPIPDAPEPKAPESKPGEKTDDAAKKKQVEDIRQLQKMHTDQARKKRDKDIENGKNRAKELSDRYDQWYYVVSNDTYKKLRVDKATFSKPKEEKKDDKSGAGGVPGLPSDLTKPDPSTTVNPNVPSPPKSDAKKEDKPMTKKDDKPATKDQKPATGPEKSKTEGDKSNPTKTEKPKEAAKPVSSEKSKDTDKAKKAPTP